MSAPLASQVLVAAGGDVLSKYGTLIWRKGLQTRGGETAYTFTRTGNGLYLANDVALGGLKVLTAGSGLARVEQLIDPVNGVLQNYLKLEAGATNSCLQSQTLATGPWGGSQMTAANAAVTAPDGTATGCTISDTATNSTHYWTQTITNTAGEWMAFSCFAKAGTHSKVLWTLCDSGTTVGYQFQVDLAAGTINAGTALTTGSLAAGTNTITALWGGWYFLTATVKIGATATTGSMFFYNVGGNSFANNTYAGDGTAVLQVWGCQIERNGANALPPTSYIATTAATASRNADAWSTPWYIAVPLGVAGGFWRYTRWLERGTFAGATTKQHLVMGNTAPRWMLLNEGSNPRIIWNNGVTEQRVTAGVTPTFGQIAETLELVDAAGNMTLRTAINAGADNVVTAGGGAPTGKVFDNVTLSAGSAAGSAPGYTNLSRCVVGLGAVSAIADVRNTL